MRHVKTKLHNECGTNREATFLLPKSSIKIWRIVSLLTPNSSAIILTVAQRSFCIRSLTFAMSPSLRTEHGRPGLASSSVVSTPPLNRAYHLNICARDKKLSPYTFLIISTVSAAVFPSLKQNLMFFLCSMPLLWPRPLTACTTWRRISRHAQRGALRCCQITDEVWAHGWHVFHHRWHFYLGQNKISRVIHVRR